MALATAALLALAGCAPQITVRPTPLPLPRRPTLTPIAGSTLQCLAPASYRTLVDRERALKTWGLKLESIIQTNNQRAKGDADGNESH